MSARWGKIVSRRAFGDAGSGPDADLAALERIPLAAAGGLTGGGLAALLDRQAQALPAEEPRPARGSPCPIHHEPRTLATGRVKRRDKYWNRSAGAEAILQVRAAVLSEDGRLARHFAEHTGNPHRRQPASRENGQRKKNKAGLDLI